MHHISRWNPYIVFPILNCPKWDLITPGKFSLCVSQTVSHFPNLHSYHLTSLLYTQWVYKVKREIDRHAFLLVCFIVPDQNL